MVELIVVLAILAILAAMLVPSLTGYIDKAKEKKDIALAREVLIANQSVLSELYAFDPKSVCDGPLANTNNAKACSIITPLTNAYRRPDNNRKRYQQTYDLVSDLFSQKDKFYISILSDKSTIINAIFYRAGTDYMLEWNKDTQTWSKTDYDIAKWKYQCEYCGDFHTFPYWNGIEHKDPKLKTD